MTMICVSCVCVFFFFFLLFRSSDWSWTKSGWVLQIIALSIKRPKTSTAQKFWSGFLRVLTDQSFMSDWSNGTQIPWENGTCLPRSTLISYLCLWHLINWPRCPLQYLWEVIGGGLRDWRLQLEHIFQPLIGKFSSTFGILCMLQTFSPSSQSFLYRSSIVSNTTVHTVAVYDFTILVTLLMSLPFLSFSLTQFLLTHLVRSYDCLCWLLSNNFSTP